MNQKVKFLNSQNSTFFATVRQRVEVHFKEKSVSKHANGAMWRKAFFYITIALTLYLLILSNQFSVWAMFGFAVLLGVCNAGLGFNVCHDAIHGSFSGNSKLNKALSFIFHFIGASPYVWNLTHNVVHHTYTNIPGHDEDIEIAPGLIRLDPEEKVNQIQRFQHLYAFGLYSLASLSWVFRKDYVKFFQKKIGQHPTVNHPKQEYFNLFFYKALYYCLYILVPLLVLDITWWQLVIGFLGLHLAEGLVMGLVFQLAHVVEGTDFPVPNEQGNIEEAWAAHQMRTTANFATRSKLMGFLLGGLNQQIEHHLFPKVCHIHYPALAGIIKQTAREFNLPYIENLTFFQALQSHYRMLKKFGPEAYQSQLKAVPIQVL
ncbi:fatty acid desaturase family protein [Adhaeribacter pallidiroseus]|uniref:Acyl-CoA 6-desaturase n=1 Tax=Adhaeribacter pallidiroseus TaxID=2072847 RepID=A0A369QMD5_9BACT|nr:acyl-CoA desaturase [Adhaeribacter pallidiroseus]RDC64407.1 Acyl-CoA 6-desaturase [Adhaeribacter pallidiroseus]